MVVGLFKSSWGSGADSVFSGASVASGVAVSGFVADAPGLVVAVLGSVAASEVLSAEEVSGVSSAPLAEFVSSSDS